MAIGFIGLGNVGAKLAGSLLRNGQDLWVHDLDDSHVADFVARGAKAGGSPAELMRVCDTVVTCLPSPAICTAVVEEMLPEMGPGKTWIAPLATRSPGRPAGLACTCAAAAAGSSTAPCACSCLLCSCHLPYHKLLYHILPIPVVVFTPRCRCTSCTRAAWQCW